MMQILHQRLQEQNEVQINDLIAMLERELSQPNNLIVKKRAIHLLVRLTDFDALNENL